MDLPEPIDCAYEPLKYLDYNVVLGKDLFTKAIELYKEKKLVEAARCSSALFQLGLNEHNAFIQGSACYLLGMIHFGLGKRPTDWPRAHGYYIQSAQLFDVCHDGENGKAGCRDHNMGVVWYSIGRLGEKQCADRHNWEETIAAYKQSFTLFEGIRDSLAQEASDSERRVTQKWKDDLIIKKHARELAFVTPPDAKPKEKNTEPPKNSAESLPNRSWRSRIGLFALIAWGVVEIAFLLWTFALAVIWITLTTYRDFFLVGFFLSLFAWLIPLVFFLLNDQLFYRVPANCAAIISYGNRQWEDQRPGRQWRVPFFEQVHGFISLQRLSTQFYVREFSAADGFTLGIQAQVGYIVINALRAWANVEPLLQPTKFLGIAKPIDAKHTTEIIEHQVTELGKAALRTIAQDPTKRDLFTQGSNSSKKFSQLLSNESERFGVQFVDVQITPKIRSDFESR